MSERSLSEQAAAWLVDHGLAAFWYICHVGNLSSVLTDGILCKNLVRRRGLAHCSFAEESVQQRRRNREVQTSTGRSRSVHDLIPLYFTPLTPTLSARREIQEDLALLRIPVDRALAGDAEFAFADGNAGARKTRLYGHPLDLAKLDVALLRARGWSSEDDEARRKRCAEFFLAEMSPDKIERIVVRKSRTRKLLIERLHAQSMPPIDIVPRYFF